MRFAGHVWRNKNELASDVLLWTPTHGKQKPGRPKRSYIDQLADDTGCYPQELDNAMSNKEDWRKRIMQCRPRSTWWWWWWSFHMLNSNFLLAVVLINFKDVISLGHLKRAQRSYWAKCPLLKLVTIYKIMKQIWYLCLWKTWNLAQLRNFFLLIITPNHYQSPW